MKHRSASKDQHSKFQISHYLEVTVCRDAVMTHSDVGLPLLLTKMGSQNLWLSSSNVIYMRIMHTGWKISVYSDVIHINIVSERPWSVL
jgi:hypothetical protein